MHNIGLNTCMYDTLKVLSHLKRSKIQTVAVKQRSLAVILKTEMIFKIINDFFCIMIIRYTLRSGEMSVVFMFKNNWYISMYTARSHYKSYSNILKRSRFV